jgi:hypothetical protein
MLQAPRSWFLENSLEVKFQLMNLVRLRALAGGSIAFQSPRPHGGAVVHDGSVEGGGGIEFFLNFFFFFLETFQSLLKYGASCKCHLRSREIRLNAAEWR